MFNHRIMGIETEYGIADVADPGANPMLLSAQIVTAYAEAVHEDAPVLWDYHSEDPLSDARGFRLDRASAHPSQLTDEPVEEHPPRVWGTVTSQRRHAEHRPAWTSNTVLTNGARFYVDHAHPEYSGPEVTNARDVVLWDRAGDEIVLRASRLLHQQPDSSQVALYKNNTDGKGASYGTHENYLIDRGVPFDDIAAILIPFFVTRPVFCGAGRVGLGQRGEKAGFQISQRADFIEAEVGLETTLRRPIVNTRDEPHADAEKYRRLHVIVGDANLVQVSTYLKVGTTAVVLGLLEQGKVPEELWGLQLADPVAAATAVSHDTTLTATIPLADGRELTAIEIQKIYLNAARRVAGEGSPSDGSQMFDRWESVLDRLVEDPLLCAREVEWVAKLRLLEGMRNRDGLDWDSPRLAAVDLQWSDLRPEKGIYHRLEQAGAVEVLVGAEEIEHAIHNPPSDTRAYFRGECIRRYPEVTKANWDSLVFDLPGQANLYKIPMPEPYRGTQTHVEKLLDSHPDAAGLIAALGG